MTNLPCLHKFHMYSPGATILGKATCENFCFSGNSFTSSPAPVLNPHDPTRSTGGSSSGCAVLVSTQDVMVSLREGEGVNSS